MTTPDTPTTTPDKTMSELVADASRPPAGNRVSPLGRIIAAPGRGGWMGNRGVLHAGTGARETVRSHRGRAWITCVLDFRGRRVPQWQPGRYTPLFFLDEAVSLAAGHRPCAECRRADFNEFRSAWAQFTGDAVPLRAPQLDAVLHGQRLPLGGRERRLVRSSWSDLPDGAFVLIEQGPAVVVQNQLTPWRSDNTYGSPVARPRSGTASVITPPASLGALHAGYAVQIDDSAR
ncbi:MAG: hypothetical protein L0H96_20645 [Humibacillus sp.]|nr:hypothetical protein [Humibacillus sp.]MDN5779307.1 hypothetical protein [Humibacillus sp.]